MDPTRTKSQEALNDAICSGDVSTAMRLLRDGYPQNVPSADVWKRNTLHLAAYHGHFQVVVDLVEDYGADMNSPDSDGNTPVYWACMGGKMDIVKYLMEKGVNTENIYDPGTCLLHAALCSGNLEISRYLCDAGVSVNLKDIHGIAPLHDAVSHRKLDHVALFLENGADVNVQDIQGHSALHLAVTSGEGIFLNKPRTQIKIMKRLAKAGANTELKSIFEYTPLINAVLEGNSTLCKLLLDMGADVNACDRFGNSVFRFAMQTGRRELVTLVLDAGCCLHKESWMPTKFWPYSELKSMALEERVCQMYSNGWRLKQLCRCVIRHLLKSDKRLKAEKLPLPRQLKDFVST